MAEPRVLVLRAAGTNCEAETAFAFEQAGATCDTLHVNRLLEAPDVLGQYGLVAIPGGFSYGDHISAGKVFAVEVSHALGDHFRAFVERGGLMLGICNGFQVLVKTGLLPGRADGAVKAASLAWNDSRRYEDRWVEVDVDPHLCVLAPKNRERLAMPVAHAEGKLVIDPESGADHLIGEHQAVFRYTTANGGEPTYPANPNGSVGHIAGLCDPTGQVLGLMPHPERALQPWHHPRWTREAPRKQGDGACLFQSAVQALR